MRKCAVCKQREAVYVMQYIASSSPSFYMPGYHVRGFRTTPVCQECADKLQQPQPTQPGLLADEDGGALFSMMEG